jgi:UDP-3-O-acyl N-acetylglucosamine deacetylase
MSFLRRQRTLGRAVTVEGVGYWSGEPIQVEFRPAGPNTGIAFVLQRPGRSPQILPACLDTRVDASRRTVLQVGTARVEMVEHIMAALAGLEIDNCEVWVDAEEMPGCDGSALSFVDALDWAGLVEYSSMIRPLVVSEPLRCGTPQQWVEVHPNGSGLMSVEYHLDYGPGNAIGRQSFAAEITPEEFRYELAPARTFVLKEEADAMIAQGKGKHVTTSDLLIFGPGGPLNNQLRFPDECVRHKVLDVVGDLALAGRPLVGHVIAYRSGHELNATLVRAILEQEERRMAASRRKSA